MASIRLRPVVAFLRRVTGRDGAGDTADEDLLRRFTLRREEAAFAELVARYGPTVLGVCRRILPDANDADDAFQATFLVLVRKAHTITRPALLGNWLYGVACRTASRAKGRAARRRSREGPLVDTPAATAPEPIGPDVLAVLDRELERLPEKYRAPVVLCYLEGKTYTEAARALGWAEGTVSGRLARAREMLRRRLGRRGVTVAGAALAAVLCPQAPGAAVPGPLLGATVRGAMLTAAGAGGVSAPVAGLAEEVVKSMQSSKLTLVLGLVAAVGVVSAGAGVLAYQAGGPAAPRAQKEAPPVKGESDGAADRAKLASFRLEIRYYPAGEKGEAFPSLLFTVPAPKQKRPAPWRNVRIGRKQAGRILDYLDSPRSAVRRNALPGLAGRLPRCYEVRILPRDPKREWYVAWGPQLFGALGGLRTALDGDALKAMDDLLAALEPVRKQWERTAKALAPIHVAARDGDLAQVKKLLAADPTLVYLKDPAGHTPLHWASISGHRDVMEYLLDRGADVHARDTIGLTPLDGVHKSSKELVEFLLARGARPTVWALQHAAREGRKDVAGLLLDRKVGVNASLDTFGTALHVAAATNHPEVAEFLLDRGASVDARTEKGATPLHEAAQRGHDRVVALLLARGADVNAKMKADLPLDGGFTPLLMAVRAQHRAAVARLLAGGADLNVRARAGQTALHVAAGGPKEIVKLLLARKPDVNAKLTYGGTPLHLAVLSRHPDAAEVVKLLLAHGADVNAGDNARPTRALPPYKSTPLHYAAQHGKVEMAKLLLEHGAKLHAVNSRNETPRDLAVKAGQKEMVRLLDGRAKGADR